MNKKKILVVEDDAALRSLVAAFLEKDKFDVVTVETAADGMDVMSRMQIDLIVLDIGLPDEDGRVLARKLRMRSDTPIIFITVSTERDCKLTALDLGADDFLVKPIDPNELSIRIRNILRRTSDPGAWDENRTLYYVDDLVVDIAGRSVVRNETESVTLTRAEFDLLAALVHARNRVLTRDHLLDAFSHGNEDPGTRLIDVLVSRLRRKLEPGGRPWRIIKTVPGIGYQLGVPVTRKD